MAKKLPYDIRDIRCAGCARFLAKGDIKQGVILIYCPKCHTWTISMGEGDEKVLTTKELNAIISSRQDVRPRGSTGTEGQEPAKSWLSFYRGLLK